MEYPQSAIGVFDSGMGGLTVLAAMHKALPQESFIYLGDTARLPYGTKSQSTVQQYASQMARILIEKNIKALVIACNTATTAALPHLQSILPDIPVIGVVTPGVAAAVNATKNERIFILATETTIAAKTYHDLIVKTLPNAFVSNRACSLLVALAEEGMVANDIARSVLNYYLADLSDEDTILLGCTHFPVFKTLLATMVADSVKIVDSAEETAKHLKIMLKKQNLLSSNIQSQAATKYLVTDSINRFQKIGEIFLGCNIAKENIILIDAN
jgi:glutamate racemase